MDNDRSTSLSGTSTIAIPNQEFADGYPFQYSSDHFQIPVAQVDEPHDPQTRDPEFDPGSGRSFAEIVRNRNSKKTKKVLQKLMLTRNNLVLVLKTTPTPKNIH
jgi:hypothetical protein